MTPEATKLLAEIGEHIAEFAASACRYARQTPNSMSKATAAEWINLLLHWQDVTKQEASQQ